MSTLIVNPSNAMAYSAFSQEVKDEFGGMRARTLLTGDRYLELERRASYYECTQHDRKFWDFDGRPINPRTMQPLMGVERATWVPLKMRRPSAPVRLGKVIVDSFTNLIFGENRFPSIRVEGDEQTEDWIQTAARVGKLSQKMIQARIYGGATGTSAVSWCFRNGKPRFEAHKAQNLFVHAWEDRLELVPAHVSEVYLFSKVKWDGKAFNKYWYWYRRDWTPEADIVFKDVMFDSSAPEVLWVVDQEKSNFHGDGVCHIEWIQNLPSDEMDGIPDYEGLYENFDLADMIMSVITRGAVLNLDPTVKLKMDRDEIGRMGIAKGSDNALIVGKDGDADYLELGGQSIEAGIKLVESLRRFILETAQCVIPDPHEVAAQGVSSVAIKAMFAPMLAKADILREQYGGAIERILGNMEKVAREKTLVPFAAVGPEVPAAAPPPVPGLDALGGGNPLEGLVDETALPPPVAEPVPPTPEEELVQFEVVLPPKIVTEPVIDPLTGKPTGEEKTTRVPRALGEGGEITVNWSPYFPPTPQDQAQITQSLQTATGGKAFLSQETATEVAAKAWGVDPAEEWRRVRAQGESDAAAQASMFDAGAAGGQVEDPTQMPPGAEPPAAPPAAPPPPGDDPDADIPVDIDLTGE